MSGIAVRCMLRALAVIAAAGSLVATTRADDLRTLTDAYNSSGHDLFVRFAQAPGNIVFSPYAIGTAMAMTLAGARGETATEMAGVLRQTLSRADIDAAHTGALATINGYDRDPATCPAGSTPIPEVTAFGLHHCVAPLPADHHCQAGFSDERRCLIIVKDPASARFRIVNALMLPKGRGDVVSADYAGLLRDRYQAELFRDADLGTVNSWVNRETEGRIDRILARLRPNADAVILNAVYFKAAWRTPFHENATRMDDFNLTPSEKTKVSMMHAMGRYPVLDGAGYRAIRLPYSVDALSMVIALPNDPDGATGLARDLDAVRLAALFRDLHAAKEIEIAVPRFRIDFTADLAPLFILAGMKRAFAPGAADFSGVTGRSPAAVQLAIGEIRHRAVIDVNESGTERAAASAIIMLASVMPAEAEPFVVDRPFLFYVVDDATGAILFQGRISDPRPPPS